MSAEPLPTHYSNFADCAAMKWTTGTVEKWLEVVGKSKWTKFLIGTMKVDGVALMSLRKEDLTIALSNGYDWVELKSLMDSIRSLRVQQTCNPGQILSRYLSGLSISESSEASKGKDTGERSGSAISRKEDQLSEDVLPANEETLRDVESETDGGIGEKASRDVRGDTGTRKDEKGREGSNDTESSSHGAHSCIDESLAQYPSQYDLIREMWRNRGRRFSGYICNYYTPNNFYVKAPEWDNDIARMERQLAERHRHLPKLGRADLFFGAACCVHDQVANRWRRGRFVKTIPESGILRVECVDHGYTVDSLLVNVKKLPDDMVEVPPLCLRCKVEGGGDYAHDEYCRDVLTALDYKVSVEVGKHRSDRFIVKLFDPHTGRRVMQLVPD